MTGQVRSVVRTPAAYAERYGWWAGRRFVAVLCALVASTLLTTAATPRFAGAAVTQPPWRFGHTMATDPVTGKVLLFGGISGSRSLDDTWTWNGAAWKAIRPSISPSPRLGAAMAADPATGTVVLFGGVSDRADTGVAVDLGDTWIWDGATRSWSQHLPVVSPPPGAAGSMAYDGATGTVVLFGGGPSSGAVQPNQTWTWHGTTRTWTLERPPVSPQGRSGATMAYDAASRTVVLFGGETASGCPCLDDTWTWDGSSGTWTQRHPAVSPRARAFAHMAYHAATAKVVLFSGYPVGSDTWTWDGPAGTWSKQAPIDRPCSRANGAMAYHPGTAGGIIFGGISRCPTTVGADTWRWNGRNWKRMA